MKLIRVCKIVAATALMGNLSVSAAAEPPGLKADEIKNVRYLSRALLKGRALEKERIERDVEPQRRQIEAMENALRGVDGSLLKSMSSTGVEPVNTSSVGEFVVDGRVVSSGEIPAQSNSGSVSVEARKEAIRKAIGQLKASRSEISKARSKKGVPSKKTRADSLRLEKLLAANQYVTKELEAILNSEDIDLKRLKALKDSVSLKKLTPDHDELEPTLETRTEHRQ